MRLYGPNRPIRQVVALHGAGAPRAWRDRNRAGWFETALARQEFGRPWRDAKTAPPLARGCRCAAGTARPLTLRHVAPSTPLVRLRLDVVVDVEQVRRIVFRLERCKTVIAVPEARAQARI